MDYIKKLEQIDRHLDEHPADYQTIIARMKLISKAIDYEQKKRTDERLKNVAKYRRMLNEESKQH